MQQNYQFTIIVPVFNEAENLLRVEQALVAYLDIAMYPTAVLFVNDGSTDESLPLLEVICKRNIPFSFISFDRNNGLSAAIKAGFDHVKTPLLGYIDSDLQTTPADFNLLLPHMDRFDLVTGVRNKRKDRFIKKITSRVANGIRRAFTNDGMEDTGCPLKVLKTETAQHIPMFKGLHRFLPAMVLLQNGKVHQIPVQHFPRIAGTAKYGVWNRLIGPLTDCFAYVWMRRKYINYTINKRG